MPEEIKYTLKELKDKLTEKEKNFCHEYVVDWNGARAARSAGYSEKNDRTIAAQNLAKLHIKQYIDYIKNDYEFLCGITKLKVLKEHHKIAFSSIAHLHDTWITRKAFEALTDDQRDCIQEIETKQTQTLDQVKIRLYDKQKSLESINKMMGYNEADKVDLSSTDGSMSPYDYKNEPTEILEKRLQIAKELESKSNKSHT